ncbi:unnamed protein product [Rotaria magnacalcarata]
MHLLATAVFVLLIGTFMVVGAANDCYSCAALGCSDTFDPKATGVTKLASPSGWCMKTKATVLGQQIVSRGPDGGTCTKSGCSKVSGAGASILNFIKHSY